MKGKKFVGLLAALTIVALAIPTFAGYTNVKRPPESGPYVRTHPEIFGDIYGGTFTGQGDDLGNGIWTEFTNGTVTAYRIYDFDEEETLTLDILTGDVGEVIDQIWTDGSATVTATATYASLNQSFGWNGGGRDPDNYIELLTQVGQFANFQVQGDFLWGYQPSWGAPYPYSYEWWSQTSLNSDGIDHLVTYKIEGLEIDETVWVLFFEDLPFDSSDLDYTDFVIEIRAIPEPASMLLLGIGGLVLLRKRRARRYF